MMPIPGYHAVRCAWLEIESTGALLYGFLLFTLGDHHFPAYVSKDGLLDIDTWSGRDCTIFVLHSPTAQWIDYSRERNNPWWKIFGNTDIPLQQQLFKTLAELPSGTFEFRGEQRTLESIFAPTPVNEFFHRDEVVRILEKFECEPTQHPCLLLFKSLRDRHFWFVDLRDQLGQSISNLRDGLRNWFASRNFKGLLEEARRV